MKTQIELQGMTSKELHNEAQTLKVKNYSKMGKAVLVTAILEAQNLLENPITDYTDLNEQVIEVGNTVDVRIGAKHFIGVITSLKTVETDQYAFVLLNGLDKSKMFHTGDIKLSPSTTEKTEKVIKTRPGGHTTYIAPEVSGEKEEKTEVEIKTPKPVAVKPVTVSKRVITPFTPEQQEVVNTEIKRYQDSVISKKELVVTLMENGIAKQQIDRYVDPKILNWSYVYDIYRAHGK